MKVVKFLNPDINVSDNVENTQFSIKSMISNDRKVEKHLPLNCVYTRLVKNNTCFQFFSKCINYYHWLSEQL